MKYSVFLLGLSLLCSAQISQAAGGLLGTNVPPPARVSFNNGVKMYAGAAVAYAAQGDACNNPFFEGECEDSSVSWKTFGGVRINPMFGAEIAYADYGDATQEGISGNERVALENDISGFQLNAIGYLPIAAMPQLEVLGKGGVMFWERETKAHQGDKNLDSKDDGIAPMLGIGTQYQLDPSLHLRAEWEHVFNAGSDSKYETDVDNYSLGLIYSTL